MTTISTGVAKKVAYKKETTFGTLAGATGATYARRIESTLNLTKASYESKEIRSDYQVADMRHGVRAVSGNIKGELSPQSYATFIGSALRADFATGATTTKSTIAASATSPHFVRSDAGVGVGWVTDGFRIGDVVRFSGFAGAGATANNSFNYRITALTEANMTVANLNGAISTATVAADAEGDSVTCAVVGKKSKVPLTGHTSDSYTIEHNYSDLDLSDVFTGCRVSSIDINMPSTGMSEITVAFMGQDMDSLVSGSSPYFTSVTAAGTSGILAAVNGKLSYDGADSGIITSLQLKIDGGMSAGSVVGSNLTPDVFPGRVKVTGSLTAYFANNAIMADFENENTPSLIISMSTGNDADDDFINITLPKIKLQGATKTDGEQGLTLSGNFQALLPAAVAGWDQSTIAVQDSAA